MKPAPVKKVKASMSYFIVYEHLLGGLVRKGNFVTKLQDRVYIDGYDAIVAIQNYLRDELKAVDPVVTDFRPLKMVKAQP